MDFTDAFDNVGEDVGDLNLNDEIFVFDNDSQSQYKSMTDAVIFLIDCNRSMVTNAISQVLQAAESFLKTKIITNENDLFGLVLYNTATTNNVLSCDGVNVSIPLSAPDAQLIKNIKILSQNSSVNYKNHVEFLRAEFPPSSKETSLNDALWICHSELKNHDGKRYNRRIFLFTDNDNPMTGSINEREKTIQRAKDMLESEIIIELFPLNFTGSFDLNKFYSNVIPVSPESNEDFILTKESSENRLRELTKRIRLKEIKKRTLGNCSLYLTKDVKFQVNIYATLKKATKPRSYNVDAKNNKMLSYVNQVICEETGSVLYQNQIGTYHNYGDKKVLFSRDDIKKIKTVDNPGIKLMGFKSLSSIKPYYNIRESYFIYPNEYLTGGSSQLCDALIKQMISKDKVGIVKFVPRDGSNIRFCALVPQKESFDEDFFQTPPGFNLVFLPYADEIRSNSDLLKNTNYQDISNTVSQEELGTARKLIKKMNIDFDSRNFENPTLQKFYATLQALALTENNVEEVEDLLTPDEEGLRRLNDYDEEFRKHFYPGSRVYDPIAYSKKPRTSKRTKANEQDEDGKKVGNKRGKKTKAGIDFPSQKVEEELISSQKGSKQKRSRGDVMDIDEDLSNEYLLNQLKKDNLDSLSVVKLRTIFSDRNIKIPGKIKKQDLIKKLTKYLNEEDFE